MALVIEAMQPKQKFIFQGRKLKVHSVQHDAGKVPRIWVECSDGTLLCERPGTYVETV
jgi:hypothetical protein